MDLGIVQGTCWRKESAKHMLKIRSRGNETVEQMLKRFKKLCEKEGLTKEIKRNSYYEKPSERKRRQMRKSVRQKTPKVGGGGPR
jgi:small subunit ribosomal protein S21